MTGLTTLELKDVAVRNPQKLPAFVTENFSYASLKKSPEFAQSTFIPFGLTHNSPLVAFKWTTPEQQQALEKFAQFAQSEAMQKLAPPLGKEVINYLQKKQIPPIPKGDVLTTAQTFWKQQKDAGQTVYLMTVIDTSGSMEGKPLNLSKKVYELPVQRLMLAIMSVWFPMVINLLIWFPLLLLIKCNINDF